ncbi:hypothetical protein E6O75_ATG04938 [Venturia nashicola]|uniref:Uncharacterized protein n=1 Tax=Venturia nashicola TaxID=86259 RepID=A0A4Z1P2C4_9PEZI|nr:hypothetical protein E6O75_ATG04938 [Venturia nashicola]
MLGSRFSDRVTHRKSLGHNGRGGESSQLRWFVANSSPAEPDRPPLFVHRRQYVRAVHDDVPKDEVDCAAQ